MCASLFNASTLGLHAERELLDLSTHLTCLCWHHRWHTQTKHGSCMYALTCSRHPHATMHTYEPPATAD